MRCEEVFTGPVFVRILMPASLLPVISESFPVVELGSTPLLRQDLGGQEVQASALVRPSPASYGLSLPVTPLPLAAALTGSTQEFY